MDKTQQNFAVMFADIAGSTRLYEKLGDGIAKQMIGEAIALVSAIVCEHQGTVIKTIGDEVMCRFAEAAQAVLCACQIQETMEKQPIRHGVGLVFRIGINWGPAILQQDGDVFGDAVNLAARIASLSKARQILITEYTHGRLPTANLLSKCRRIDHLAVKGKEQPVSIIEVMWEPNDVTRMSTIISDKVALTSEAQLNLYYQHRKFTLSPENAGYSFGRDGQCDQMVASSLASRIHARIESRRGKFILIDESTNGTYLQVDDKSPIFLRREEVLLQGSRGMISFGEELNPGSDFVLRYSF